MGTSGGFAFFPDPDVHKFLKRIPDASAEFLVSPESVYILGNDSIGWFSTHGTESLAMTANAGQTSHKFEGLFIFNLSKEHPGYKSWNEFFTRHFYEHERSVAEPENGNAIANTCESKPHAHNVARNISTR